MIKYQQGDVIFTSINSSDIDFVTEHIDEYQREGDFYFEAFSDTQDQDLLNEEDGVVIEENDLANLPIPIDINRVVISAPHAQQTYRPTKWYSGGNPTTGAYSPFKGSLGP